MFMFCELIQLALQVEWELLAKATLSKSMVSLTSVFPTLISPFRYFINPVVLLYFGSCIPGASFISFCFDRPASGNSAVMQPTLVTNPFGTLPALPQISISQGGNSPSIQYGISSMPVSLFCLFPLSKFEAKK